MVSGTQSFSEQLSEEQIGVGVSPICQNCGKHRWNKHQCDKGLRVHNSNL